VSAAVSVSCSARNWRCEGVSNVCSAELALSAGVSATANEEAEGAEEVEADELMDAEAVELEAVGAAERNRASLRSYSRTVATFN
jgi:hypothetical protein